MCQRCSRPFAKPLKASMGNTIFVRRRDQTAIGRSIELSQTLRGVSSSLIRLVHGTVVLIAAVLASIPLRVVAAEPSEPSVIATGDFNGDGIADIVESTGQDGDVAGPQLLVVLLGRADGTFGRVDSRIPLGGDPRAIVVGDFNRDGNADVIVGDGDGTLLEFAGNGRGNLVPLGKVATLGSVVSITAGHFTRGHNLDLVVSDAESNAALVLLGNGDGSFRQTWAFELPQRGMEFHLATADFNRDGLADIVITSEDHEGDYEVMLGNGNGTFSYAPQLSHLRDPNSYCPT